MWITLADLGATSHQWIICFPIAQSEQALTRADVERLLASPSHLIDCGDLEEAGPARSTYPADVRAMQSAPRRLHRREVEGTAWRSCRAAFAQFTGADLSDATFVASDFNNCVLRESTLCRREIRAMQLTGVDLSNAKALDIRFDETLLIHANCRDYRSASRP